MPQYRRYYESGSCVFLSIVTHQRRPIFQQPENIQKLRLALAQMKSEMPVDILAAVVLPDHLHFLWQLPESDGNYSKRVGRMKVLFSKSVGEMGTEAEYLSASRLKHRERGIWQRRFWESTVRDGAELEAYGNYIHFNPVKHGYVNCPHEWEYSSFHRWVEAGKVSSNWRCNCGG